MGNSTAYPTATAPGTRVAFTVDQLRQRQELDVDVDVSEARSLSVGI